MDFALLRFASLSCAGYALGIRNHDGPQRMTATAIAFPDLPAAAGRLSGLVVGQLGPGEQFVLWALRQRSRDGDEVPSPTLIRGFRLAFGLASLEAALAAFEGLFRVLSRGSRGRDVGILPLRCACVSAGERLLLGLVAVAQAGGEGLSLEAHAPRVAEPATAGALRGAADVFARELRRADLAASHTTRATSALH
jgi:hypothetical protein